ncbi:MAG: ABC transporter ATP-binding protein [Clostridia bacterium]|nr:ABC transporter ATP-binding protein [Clostridia bacterium]
MKNSKEKKKKEKLPLKRTLSNNLFALRCIGKASPLYLALFLCSSFIYGILGFLEDGYLLRKIVNGIENGDNIRDIFTYVVVLATVCILTYTGLNWFWYVVSPGKHRRVAAYIEKILFHKAAKVELACYENPAFYDKYVRAMDEAYHRMLKVLYTLRNLSGSLVELTANSLLIFLIDPWLILFGLLPLLLGFFRRLVNIENHKLESEKKPINRRANYVRRTFYLGEYAKEMRIGRMYVNILESLKNTYIDFRRLILKRGLRKGIYSYIQSIGLEVCTVLGAALYAVWSTMCLGSENGGMTMGDCIVVLSSIGSISYCLNRLVQYFAEFGEHALFLEDVRYFIDYEPAIQDGPDSAPESGGDLRISNLSFCYEGNDKDTLKKISFTLHKGERIALVGSNGSGKTTLIKLLLRLYDPNEGEISLNGQNIKTFETTSYRDLFSTVFQDFKMFSMSVKDNVLLRLPQEGDEELVHRALKESGVYERIGRLNQGIYTTLTKEFDEKGENLSVGEQQKVSLARIFAEKAPFVIMDEPTSALDPIAEYKMFENMMRATEGKSVIFISHRLSSAVLADRVLLMEDGRIVESGTHKELMTQNGKYATMFRQQAENYLGKGENGHGEE